MTMLERVAQAIEAEHDRQFPDNLPKTRAEQARLFARAALEVMRNPDYAMETAYWRAMGGDRCNPDECLEAMIDAALK